MELHIFTEPQQGASYDDLLTAARAAEQLGFSGFFRSDHYLPMSGDGGAGPTDAWTTLAGLARETSTIRLGTLVSSATFRLPGPLAVQVAQVDQMSGGRVELGLGAGWFEREHAALAIPFPAIHERFDRLEEQLAILQGVWKTPRGEAFSFSGAHYRIEEWPALASCRQPGGVPIIIGGTGRRRTPALAARYAAEFNVIGQSLSVSDKLFGRVRDACADVGREPHDLRYSVALPLCLGTTNAAVRRRADAAGLSMERLHIAGLVGSAGEVVASIAEYARLGVTRVYLQILDLWDLDHLGEVAADVLPQVR